MIRSDDGGAPPGKVLVIGLGNPDRGDDGIGEVVARQVMGRVPPDVAVKVRRGDLLTLIDDWLGFDGLVCIDAAAPMGVPGRIRRLDLSSTTLPGNLAFTSSHDFGLPEALELGRSLQRAPRRVVVYTIEGDSFLCGEPLTAAVKAAAHSVIERVVAEVGRLRCSAQEARFGPAQWTS